VCACVCVCVYARVCAFCFNEEKYLKALEEPNLNQGELTTEGFGIAYRIKKYNSNFIKNLILFLNGMEFSNALLKKFDITNTNISILTTIQKYLTKYEISPHPDWRRKCMTYLININESDDISNFKVHTHLLKFKKEKEYIYDYWLKNPTIERCWVPWEWCETAREINRNNTMVVFSPANDTLHGVKLDYSHTEFQRTQIYGNFYFKSAGLYKKASYTDLPSINSRQ